MNDINRVQSKYLIFFGLFVLLISFLRWKYPEHPMIFTGSQAILDSVFSLDIVIILAILACAIGIKFFLRLNIYRTSKLEWVLFSLPSGLGIISYGIMVLGLVGLLRSEYIIAWLSFIAIITWRELCVLFDMFTHSLNGMIAVYSRLIFWKKILVLTASFIFLLTLLLALTPPWDYDGLMYHLEGPRKFLEHGKIVLLPDIWQANGPLTIEMIYTIGLIFGSDTFAKLVNLIFSVLLFLSTYAFGKRFLKPGGDWISVAILLGIPILPLWASSTNVDIAWAVFEFLSLYALLIWNNTGRRSWLVLSGLMIGFALGSKLLAQGGVLVLVLLIILIDRRNGLKSILKDVSTLIVVSILVGIPWYLKNWFLGGNPVYPLYFGGLEWPADRVYYLMGWLQSFGMGNNILDYLFLPWNIYINPRQFSLLGNIEIPSILFILIFLYPLTKKSININLLVIYTVLRFILWSVGSQQIRFLLPIFPVLSIVSAWVFVDLTSRYFSDHGKRIIQISVLGALLVSTIYFSLLTQKFIRPWSVVLGFESKKSFLSRTVSNFQAVTYIRDNLDSDNRVLMLWDGQGYYCGELCLPDAEQSRWVYYYNNNPGLSEMVDLLDKKGITHILFSNDANLLIERDTGGDHQKALNFLFNQFLPACGKELYSDDWSKLYEMVCG